jgi:hypothetical protein
MYKFTAFLACLACSAPTYASVQLNAVDTGWYDGSSHSPSNTNYYVDNQYRNFFVFDLSGVTPISSAFLRVFSYTVSGPINYTVYDVTTNIASLTNGTGGAAAWTDLGSGTAFSSSISLNALNSNSFIDIPLNSNAVAAINSSLGSLFATGGDGVSGGDFAYGFSGGGVINGQFAVQLHIDEAVGAVPEPFSVAVWGGLFVAAGIVAFRRRSS